MGQERQDPMEIDVGGRLYAVTFSANGEYIWSGGRDVQVWRVQDGMQMAAIRTRTTSGCLAASKDGKWIAAGTHQGDVLVWNAKTHKQVFARNEDSCAISGVDFSPDSTRLVSASYNCTAAVWDIASRKKVHTLHPKGPGIAAKYSPQGDRIATASPRSVRVYDSNDGHLLVDIEVTVATPFNAGLLWFNNYLLVISDGKIKHLEASTGTVISEWPVPDTVSSPRITTPKHGEFIAFSAERTVTFWDTSTHAQLGLIQHSEDIASTALSSDDRFLAIGGKAGKITIQSLSPITVSSIYCGIIRYLSCFFTPTITTHRIQSPCPVYTPLFGNQTFTSTTRSSIYGTRADSQTRRHC